MKKLDKYSNKKRNKSAFVGVCVYVCLYVFVLKTAIVNGIDVQ